MSNIRVFTNELLPNRGKNLILIFDYYLMEA
jgi:hypothetical protein